MPVPAPMAEVAKVREKRRTISASLVVIPPGSSTLTAKTFENSRKYSMGKKQSQAHEKFQTEANAKVLDLNGKTERALRTFALLYARFDQVISDVVIVVKDFDKEFARMLDEMEKVKEAQRSVEIIAQAVHDSREHYHRPASDFDEVEGASNEWLGCMHKLISEMTTTTSAMSIGTGDRSEKEQDHSKRLALMSKVLNDEDWGGQYENVAAGSPCKSWRSYGEGLRGIEKWKRCSRRSSRICTT